MPKKSNHVIPSEKQGGWTVKKSGSVMPSKSFDRKEDAIKYAKELSKREQTELYIHKKDGTVQERNSYVKSTA